MPISGIFSGSAGDAQAEEQPKSRKKEEKPVERLALERARNAQVAKGPKASNAAVVRAMPKLGPTSISEEDKQRFVQTARSQLAVLHGKAKENVGVQFPELKEASETKIESSLSEIDIEKKRVTDLDQEYKDSLESNQLRAARLMYLFDNQKEPYVVDTLVLGAGPNAVFVAGNYHQELSSHEEYDPKTRSSLPKDIIYVGESKKASFSAQDLGLMGQEARFVSPDVLSRQPADYMPERTISTERTSIESFAKAIEVTKDHLQMPILEAETKKIEVREKTQKGWEVPECKYRVAVRNKYIYTNKIDVATGLGTPRTLPATAFFNISKDDAYNPSMGKDGIAPVVLGQLCNRIPFPEHTRVVVYGGGGTAASNVDTLLNVRDANLVSWIASKEDGFNAVRAVGDWGDKLMDKIEHDGKKKVCTVVNISYDVDKTLHILVKDNQGNYSVIEADHLISSIGQEESEFRELITDVAGARLDQMLPLYGYEAVGVSDASGNLNTQRVPITSHEEVKGSNPHVTESQPIGIISQDGNVRILGAASRSGLGLVKKKTKDAPPQGYETYTTLADKVSRSKPAISSPAGGINVSADSIQQAVRSTPERTFDINTASPAQLMECIGSKAKVKWIIEKRSQLVPHPSGTGFVNGFISKEHLEQVMKDDPRAQRWAIDISRLKFKNY